MKFRRTTREPLSVNLTPLIDVVFLLLIFFMVSTTFTRETQLSIDLPEAEGQARQSIEEEIEILIDEAGSYRVNGQGLVDSEHVFAKRAAIAAVIDPKAYDGLF